MRVRGEDWTAWIMGLITAALLTACGSSDMSDLEKQVNEILARPGGRIEPIPQIKPHERYLYQSGEAGRRDPFKPLFDRQLEEVKERVLSEDQKRYQEEIQTHNREELENFELDSLKMVGILENESGRWGLVKDKEGAVHRVQVGNYIGRNYGKITNIEEDRIELREVVDDGQGGWLERQASLTVSEEE